MKMAFDGILVAVFSKLTVPLKAMPVLIMVICGVFVSACDSPSEKVVTYMERAQQLYDEGDLVKAEIEAKNTQQIQPKNADAAFMLARIAEQRNDFQKMAQNLRIAIESRPDFVEARVKLGTLYTLGGAQDLAKRQATYLADNGHDGAGVRILNARISAAQGDIEQAKMDLETALEMEPDNTRAMGLLASITATEDMDSALELIDKGIAVSEDDKSLRLLKIRLLEQVGRSEAVDVEYQAIINEHPDDSSLVYQYARYLTREGRIEEVEPLLRQIVDNNPDNIQARIALIQFVANTRGEEAAEELLKEFIEELPEAYEFRLILARFYQGADRPDAAYEQYEVIATAVPNDDEGLTAKAKMAGMLIARGEKESGKAMIEEVLATDPANSDALLVSGAIKVDEKRYREAVADFRTLLRKEPDNKRAQIMIARTHTVAGDVVLAKDAYRRVLEIDPVDGLAPMELTRLLVADDDFDEAEKVLRARLLIQPADAAASRALLAVLISKKEFAAAEAEARRLGEQSGQQLIADYFLGGVYQAEGKHEEAVVEFRKALDKAPTAREPLDGLVASLTSLGRTDEAVAYLEKLTAEYPDNLYAKTLLGQLLAGSGDAVAAEKVLESTLESNEGWIPAYTVLAGLQGDDVGAQIDIYKRGLKAMPGDQQMTLLLGTAYESSGRIDEAIAAYEEVLAINPNSPAVVNNLAALLTDYRQDEESLERALRLAKQFENSDNPAFIDTLGWAYYRLGEYDQAVLYIEKAVEAAPNAAVLRYHLGMAYIAVDKPMSAKAELEKALENKDVDFIGIEEARSALAKLQ